MYTQTITVPTNSGEVTYFTLSFSGDFNEFIENISYIENIEDVKFGEDNGLWTIL